MFELKPCPFCGAPAELKEVRNYRTTGWRVHCSAGCASSTPVWVDLPAVGGDGQIDSSTWHTSDQAAKLAIDTWNRRKGERDEEGSTTEPGAD